MVKLAEGVTVQTFGSKSDEEQGVADTFVTKVFGGNVGHAALSFVLDKRNPEYEAYRKEIEEFNCQVELKNQSMSSSYNFMNTQGKLNKKDILKFLKDKEDSFPVFIKNVGEDGIAKYYVVGKNEQGKLILDDIPLLDSEGEKIFDEHFSERKPFESVFENFDVEFGGEFNLISGFLDFPEDSELEKNKIYLKQNKGGDIEYKFIDDNGNIIDRTVDKDFLIENGVNPDELENIANFYKKENKNIILKKIIHENGKLPGFKIYKMRSVEAAGVNLNVKLMASLHTQVKQGLSRVEKIPMRPIEVNGVEEGLEIYFSFPANGFFVEDWGEFERLGQHFDWNPEVQGAFSPEIRSSTGALGNRSSKMLGPQAIMHMRGLHEVERTFLTLLHENYLITSKLKSCNLLKGKIKSGKIDLTNVSAANEKWIQSIIPNWVPGSLTKDLLLKKLELSKYELETEYMSNVQNAMIKYSEFEKHTPVSSKKKREILSFCIAVIEEMSKSVSDEIFDGYNNEIHFLNNIIDMKNQREQKMQEVNQTLIDIRKNIIASKGYELAFYPEGENPKLEQGKIYMTIEQDRLGEYIYYGVLDENGKENTGVFYLDNPLEEHSIDALNNVKKEIMQKISNIHYDYQIAEISGRHMLSPSQMESNKLYIKILKGRLFCSFKGLNGEVSTERIDIDVDDFASIEQNEKIKNQILEKFFKNKEHVHYYGDEYVMSDEELVSSLQYAIQEASKYSDEILALSKKTLDLESLPEQEKERLIRECYIVLKRASDRIDKKLEVFAMQEQEGNAFYYIKSFIGKSRNKTAIKLGATRVKKFFQKGVNPNHAIFLPFQRPDSEYSGMNLRKMIDEVKRIHLQLKYNETTTNCSKTANMVLIKGAPTPHTKKIFSNEIQGNFANPQTVYRNANKVATALAREPTISRVNKAVRNSETIQGVGRGYNAIKVAAFAGFGTYYDKGQPPLIRFGGLMKGIGVSLIVGPIFIARNLLRPTSGLRNISKIFRALRAENNQVSTAAKVLLYPSLAVSAAVLAPLAVVEQVVKAPFRPFAALGNFLGGKNYQRKLRKANELEVGRKLSDAKLKSEMQDLFSEYKVTLNLSKEQLKQENAGKILCETFIKLVGDGKIVELEPKSKDVLLEFLSDSKNKQHSANFSLAVDTMMKKMEKLRKEKDLVYELPEDESIENFFEQAMPAAKMFYSKANSKKELKAQLKQESLKSNFSVLVSEVGDKHMISFKKGNEWKTVNLVGMYNKGLKEFFTKINSQMAADEHGFVFGSSLDMDDERKRNLLKFVKLNGGKDLSIGKVPKLTGKQKEELVDYVTNKGAKFDKHHLKNAFNNFKDRAKSNNMSTLEITEAEKVVNDLLKSKKNKI